MKPQKPPVQEADDRQPLSRPSLCVKTAAQHFSKHFLSNSFGMLTSAYIRFRRRFSSAIAFSSEIIDAAWPIGRDFRFWLAKFGSLVQNYSTGLPSVHMALRKCLTYL